MGKKHEKDGIQAYENEQKMIHDNFVINPVGFCINSEYPYFGASPDAMVSCLCCGSGCVEVKCPFLLKNNSIEDMCKKSSFFLKQSENGIF